MKWIKTHEQLPPYGKTVLVIIEHPIAEYKFYKIGHYCCKKGWEIDKDADIKYQYFPIMWSELPSLEPE